MGPSEVRREHEMTNLTERKAMADVDRMAMEAIASDCDEIDGWGFTRPSEVIGVVGDAIGGELEAIKSISRLNAMNLIDICTIDNTLWMRPEIFEQFC